MAPPRTLLGILTIALALLAGCTQPNPMGEPTYTCTPTDGTTPYPCYKVQYDAKAKEDALYTEAETVYRKFFAEHERISRAGGVSEPTPALLETTTGAFLTSVMSSYKALKEAGGTATGGAFVTAWIKRAPVGTTAASVVAIQVCTDTHTVQMNKTGGVPQPGLINIRTLSFVRVGGALKIADGSFQQVTQC